MLFKWETIREIAPHPLHHQGKEVPGAMCEVELTTGESVQVWRSSDGQQFFCHGLTFGGKDAPGGAISPYTGESVETILQAHFQSIPEFEAQPGDILVWRGVPPESTPHSAVLVNPIMAAGATYLADLTKVQTKNGLMAETDLTLEELIAIYSESYNVYRRRS